MLKSSTFGLMSAMISHYWKKRAVAYESSLKSMLGGFFTWKQGYILLAVNSCKYSTGAHLDPHMAA